MSRSDAPGREDGTVDAFAGVTALAAMWGRGGEAALTLQKALLHDFTAWFAPPPESSARPDAQGGADGADDPGPSELGGALRAYERSWKTALDVADTTFSNLLDRRPALTGEAAPLREILDPRGWFPDAPRPEAGSDPIRDLAGRADRVAAALAAFRRRGIEHEIVLIEAWMRSAGAFARALLDGSTAHGSDPGDLARLWSETTGRTLDELSRTAPFATTMRALIDAAHDLQAARLAFGEALAAAYGLPGRAEVDSLRSALAEMGRELRELTLAARPASGAAVR